MLTLAYTPFEQAYLPILAMLVVATGFVMFSVFISPYFGPNRPNEAKSEAYECGIPSVGTARVQVFVRFYLVALLFLLFDMEIVYIILWALAFTNPDNVQVPGFIPYALALMVIYMAILMIGLIYEWRKGALNWNN